jgi:hypothetical protein
MFYFRRLHSYAEFSLSYKMYSQFLMSFHCNSTHLFENVRASLSVVSVFSVWLVPTVHLNGRTSPKRCMDDFWSVKSTGAEVCSSQTTSNCWLKRVYRTCGQVVWKRAGFFICRFGLLCMTGSDGSSNSDKELHSVPCSAAVGLSMKLLSVSWFAGTFNLIKSALGGTRIDKMINHPMQI